MPVTVLGSGRAVVGQSLNVELTREEVVQILTAGFLPITAVGELPARGRPTGLRELGLPYASDPAITRHLAAFLTQAAAARNSLPTSGWFSPTHCSSMAAFVRRLSFARGLSRRFPPGSAEPKAAGGPSCSRRSC